MWTPFGALRRWVRRQAREDLSDYIGEAEAGINKAVQRVLRSWPADIVLLADDEIRATLDQQNVILDHTFRKPSVLGGYIDVSELIEGESCRIEVLVQTSKEDLTRLYTSQYAGPVEDAIALHEQPVVGRVKVVYTQVLGRPKSAFYRFYSRR